MKKETSKNRWRDPANPRRKTEKSLGNPKYKSQLQTQEKVNRKRTMILFFSLVAISLTLVARQFHEPDAIILPEPFGIIYFDENPDLITQSHEKFHQYQMERDGVLGFYFTYVFGKGCVYEWEAGYAPDEHEICKIPWMDKPTEDQKHTREEILAWYQQLLAEEQAQTIRSRSDHE